MKPAEGGGFKEYINNCRWGYAPPKLIINIFFKLFYLFIVLFIFK